LPSFFSADFFGSSAALGWESNLEKDCATLGAAGRTSELAAPPPATAGFFSTSAALKLDGTVGFLTLILFSLFV
jgi:hypothetical protein